MLLLHGGVVGIDLIGGLLVVAYVLAAIVMLLRTRAVALLLDEDSCHTAEDSQSLADDYAIELLWLPKRSPHLNPMDHLWRHGKEVMLANYQYASMDTQAERFLGYLLDLPAEEALRKAGILSGNFWLRT